MWGKVSEIVKMPTTSKIIKIQICKYLYGTEGLTRRIGDLVPENAAT